VTASPVYSEIALGSPELSAVRAAIRQVLAVNEPYPAVAVDRRWNVVDASAGVMLLVGGAAQELLVPPTNMLRMSPHPAGLAPRIVNLGEWRAQVLGRLRRRVAATADAELADLYEELRGYPCDQPEPEIELPRAGEIVVPLRIRQGGRELAFFNTVTTVGSPLDATVAELAIESFFPADPDTAAVLRTRAAALPEPEAKAKAPGKAGEPREEVLDSPIGWVAEHIRRYVETDGASGHQWLSSQVLLLTTRGRKSGRLLRTALIYGRDGADYLLVASDSGAANHPSWYLNLVAHPEVEVQVGADRFSARARTATAEEKPRLWRLMVSILPQYNSYQEKTSRDIPVVILERV
jgi:deazaflavin-dependent oxidoreductase (nitroreductase family)